MIVLDSQKKEMMLENTLHRELIIRFPDASEGELKELRSENIIAESFEMIHSICDDKEFVMGGCIAGQLSVKVINVEQALNDKRIDVYIKQTYSKGPLYPSDDLYPSEDLYPGLQKDDVTTLVFRGRIDSSLRQKNRAIKEIIAYDDMYRLSRIKCGIWLRGYIRYTSNFTLKQLFTAAIDHLGAVDDDFFVSDTTDFFVNDSKVLTMSSELADSVISDDITYVDLLNAYCELNARFGIVNRKGELKFIKLYSEVDTATIKKPVNEVIDSYANLSFEEFTTRSINLIQFQYNRNSYYKYGYSTEKQSWYSSDNLITSCCTDISELVTAFNDNNGSNYIFGDLYSYRPFSADIFARWWIEPGDKVQIKTGYNDTEIVESFVFKRKIKGINGMRVTIEAKGVEFLGKDEIESD